VFRIIIVKTYINKGLWYRV